MPAKGMRSAARLARFARVTLLKAPSLLAALAFLASCGDQASGPLRVTAIGPQPTLINPNLQPVTAPSAMLLETVAQGLVRFDAAGEIEPALAQSWIVSDDGRRYTFRLRRALWARGERVTAEQVVARLQAALSRASRNRLKPVLGAIADVEAMTDQVLEIRLVNPRANFLQLLAQPEMAIIANGEGTGPYRMGGRVGGALRLVPPLPEDEEAPQDEGVVEIQLAGASPAIAIARFRADEADFVTGGTAGDLPILRAAEVPQAQIAFDPTLGLFGLAFQSAQGPLGDPAVRRALSMAIDRAAILERFSVPDWRPRTGLLPAGLDEVPAPAAPDWANLAFPQRRELATLAIAGLDLNAPLRLRIAMPNSPGYRILFAHLRRDWRLIGVEVERVAASAPAELRLIDEVAPARLSSWYLRPFMCPASPVCNPEVTALLDNARSTGNPAERRALLAQADQALTNSTAFIPIANPVRWSLRTQRLTGFRTNMFARHPPFELIQARD